MAVIACSWEMVDVRVLIDPNDKLIRDSDIELPAPTMIRFRSKRRCEPAELRAAATETVKRIVSALAKARQPVLEQALT